MFRYLPGFRSGKKFKMVIAISYYLITAIAAISVKDVGMLIAYIGLPIAILNFSEYRINRLKGYKVSSVVGLTIFALGMYISGALVPHENIQVSNNKPTPEVKKKTNNTTIKEKELDRIKLTFNNISEEQNKEAINILTNCGITEIKNAEYDSTLDWEGLKGYRLSTEHNKIGEVIAYFDDIKLRQVRFLGEYLYKSGEIVQDISTIINRPDLEVVEYASAKDGYFRYVIGKVRNNTNKTYSYAQISINLYSNGNLVGSTLDNINNLEPGMIWEFKALVTEDNIDQFKIIEVNGF